MKRLKFFMVLTVLYAAFNLANNYATESLYLETGAHLIHLPSGVRLVIVLVAGLFGAAAITLATFPYAYLILFKSKLALSLVVSLTTSLIPLTIVSVLRKKIKFRKDLSDLNLKKLFYLSITYAAVNSTVQQFVFYLFNASTNLTNAWLVMFTGDILGIVIVLYLIRFIGKLLSIRKARN